jgi:hypothetical protein
VRQAKPGQGGTREAVKPCVTTRGASPRRPLRPNRPEASLASARATSKAKRRQRVREPCNSASKDRFFAKAEAVRVLPKARSLTSPGSQSRARAQGSSRNLGDPVISADETGRATRQKPKVCGGRHAKPQKERRQHAGAVPRATAMERTGRMTGSRIRPKYRRSRGTRPRGPGGGKGRTDHGTKEGTTWSHRPPKTSQRNSNE